MPLDLSYITGMKALTKDDAAPTPRKKKAKAQDKEEHAQCQSELSEMLEKPCVSRHCHSSEWDDYHSEMVTYFAEMVLEVPVEEAAYLYSLAQGKGDVYAKELEAWLKKRPALKTQANVPRPVAPKKTDYQAIKEWYLKRNHYGVQPWSKIFPNEESAVSSLHLIKMLLGDMSEVLNLEVCHKEADWIDDSSEALYNKAYQEFNNADSKWMDLPAAPEWAFRRSSDLYLKAKSFESLADWAANVVYSWRETMLPFCKDSSHVTDESLAGWASPSCSDERKVLRRAVQMAELLGELPPVRTDVHTHTHTETAEVHGLLHQLHRLLQGQQQLLPEHLE